VVPHYGVRQEAEEGGVVRGDDAPDGADSLQH